MPKSLRFGDLIKFWHLKGYIWFSQQECFLMPSTGLATINVTHKGQFLFNPVLPNIMEQYFFISGIAKLKASVKLIINIHLSEL